MIAVQPGDVIASEEWPVGGMDPDRDNRVRVVVERAGRLVELTPDGETDMGPVPHPPPPDLATQVADLSAANSVLVEALTALLAAEET